MSSLLILPLISNGQSIIPPGKTVVANVDGSMFAVNTNVISASIGYGSSWYNGKTSNGFIILPSIGVAYERGLTHVGKFTLGLGASIGYQYASIKTTDSYTSTSSSGSTTSTTADDKFSCVSVALRGALHFTIIPKLDTYGALGIGLNNVGFDVKETTETTSGYGTSSSHIGFKLSQTDFRGVALVGGRYYLSPQLGLFAEFGYDQTYLKVGGVFKF